MHLTVTFEQRDTILDRDTGVHGLSEETLCDTHERGTIWNRLMRETMNIDPIWGPKLLKDMILWAKFTNDNKDVLMSSFSTLLEFMTFRESDIAKE